MPSIFDQNIIIKHFNSMGPVVSFLKEKDQLEPMEKAAKEAIDIALKLVNTRFDAFEAQINLQIGPIKKIPGKLIASKKIISANVSQGTKMNFDAISEIVYQFQKGKMNKCINNTLFNELDRILGSFSASYGEEQGYMLLTNQIGGTYRLDYIVVQQQLSATGITSKVSRVLGAQVIVSSVAKADIKDENIYKLLISRQFPNNTIEIKLILLKLLKGEPLAAEEAKKVEDLTFVGFRFNKDGDLVNERGDIVYPPRFERQYQKRQERLE